MNHTFRRGVAGLVVGLPLVLGWATPAAAHDHRMFYPPPGQEATAQPVRSIGPVQAGARVADAVFSMPGAGAAAQVVRRDLLLTRNPSTPLLYEQGFTTPEDECVEGECAQFEVAVPAGTAPHTLYARAVWPLQNYYVHIWGISPQTDADGNPIVVGRSAVAASFDKTVGNERAVPLAEFHVADPAPGTWRIQVRAVFGNKIPVDTTIALAAGKPVAYERLGVMETADKYFTQKVSVNLVFAGRQWSADEIAEFREHMPAEYRPGVLQKQGSDCDPDDDRGGANSVLNWEVCHYAGTKSPDAGGYKPYFEPIKFTYDYAFLQANETWTRDLFAKAKSVTRRDAAFDSDDAADYLALYDAHQGKVTRDPAHRVTNPTVSDKIDAFAVEDWIYGSRDDTKYSRAFTDIETGETRDGRFITPDLGGYYDPFYTAKGRKNLEIMPQGTATSFTFFVLDTYTADYAADYFRPSAYHHWDVSMRMIDPDTGAEDGPDWARVWGGRYRFFFHDLGAGPNHWETFDFFAGAVPGSAAKPFGDPPIWDYLADPSWRGLLVERTRRSAVTMLLFRFTPSYLYRPVPADVYFLASNNWHDCYADPECSPDGISHTRLEEIYQPSYVEKNLSAALPGVTFTTERSDPTLQTYRYLGCARERAVSNRPAEKPVRFEEELESLNDLDRGGVILVPDPNCTDGGDPIQQVLEYAKARGDDLAGAGVNDAGASGFVVRQWVEEHRNEIAPLRSGQFTLTNISVVWPGVTTWFLPAVVGGVALPTPNGEIWGILNNTNDRAKPAEATNCATSKPFAPGCNGVPPLREEGVGFSYTVQHEASHFLGLLHPHDSLTVDKDTDGKWRYYGTSYRHYGDSSMAPTTYAGAIAPYSVLDQDIIQRGHVAEYAKMAEDTLADAYLLDGIAGRTGPSAITLKKVAESHRWRDMGSDLFAAGDYLKAERAMRNAFLAAQGVYGPVVPARTLRPGENVLFEVKAQPSFDSRGRLMSLQRRNTGDGTTKVGGSKQRRTLPSTGADGAAPLVGVLLLALAVRARTSRRRIS